MPIKPISVLPQYSPVSAGKSDNRFMERMMLEQIQSEAYKQRDDNKNAFEVMKSFGDSLDKNKFMSDIPYQQRAFQKVTEMTSQAAKDIQQIRDPLEKEARRQEYQIGLYSDPDIQNAHGEQVLTDKFLQDVASNPKKVNPYALQQKLDKIYDPNRTTPLTGKDLNVSSINYQPDEYAKDYLDSIQSKKTETLYDDKGNIVQNRTTEAIPEDAADRLKKKMIESGAFPDYTESQISTFADRYVKDRNDKNIGSVSLTAPHGFTSDPDKEKYGTGKLSPQEKKLKVFNDNAESINGQKFTTVNGKDVVGYKDADTGDWTFSVGGGDRVPIEKHWNNLTQDDKQKLIAVGADPVKFKTKNGKDIISEDDFKDESLNKNFEDNPFKGKETGNGLMKEDAQKAGDKSYVAIKNDGANHWLETNNPAVLDKIGYTLTYNKDGYSITDESGKSISENHDKNKVGDFTAEKDDTGRKIFKVRLDPHTPEEATSIGQTQTSGQDIGATNNNPQNLKGKDGNLLKFDSAKEGLQAGVEDLNSKIDGTSSAMKTSPYMKSKYGDNLDDYKDFATVEDLLNVRTPTKANGGDNDPKTVDNFLKHLDNKGFPKTMLLSDLTGKDKANLNKAIVEFESPASYNKLYGSGDSTKDNSGTKIEFKNNPDVDPKHVSGDAETFLKGLKSIGVDSVLVTGLNHHASKDSNDIRLEKKVFEKFTSDDGQKYFADNGYIAHEEYKSKKEYEDRLEELGLSEDKGKDKAYFKPNYVITYNPNATGTHIHLQRNATSVKEKANSATEPKKDPLNFSDSSKVKVKKVTQ